MDEFEMMKLMLFNYYVFFTTEQIEEVYSPIVYSFESSGYDTTHIWDNELDAIIPAVWYIMHLPRVGFDVIENDIELVLHSHDEPHNIIPLPYSSDNSNFNDFLMKSIVNPTIIICVDEIYEEVSKRLSNVNSLLGLYKMSELNSYTLQEHWKKLADVVAASYQGTECIIDASVRLTCPNERKIIPLIPLANQLGYTKQLMDECEKLNQENNGNKYCIALHQEVLRVYKLLADKDEKFKQQTEKCLIENTNFNGMPLVITYPGTMQYQVHKFKRSRELPMDENEVISVLGYHRALAKNALYISMNQVSQDLYTELSRLEEHCKTVSKINNVFVWRTLRRLGKLLNNALKGYDIDILKCISQITVFSDFPIGLAILPGSSAPLCCIKPISYRTLTPLTRAFQLEMGKEPQVYLGNSLKILILECVDRNDNIRKYCDGLTHSLTEMSRKESNVSMYIEEIHTVSSFIEALNKHSDIDILLVSAHGSYKIESNMAGLVIGNELWMASEDRLRVPPVVLLSACHVMPRGRGVVSVADLFMRAGAKTVLGTFIPVDVRRNAMLITRLFTDIYEVRKGWSNMRTLDEIWCHVVCTNAIHEIIASNSSNDSKLEIWANTKNSNGVFPQGEFKNNYSVGRLRCTHAYEDTEKILGEIAERDGIGDYYQSYLKTQGYFPESVFYQLIGTPENIFIRNSVMSDYDKLHENK